MREPVAVEKLYPRGETIIKKLLDDLSLSKKGPGTIPSSSAKGEKIKGIIVPHGKYELAGSCALWAYHKLAESVFYQDSPSSPPDLFIILSPNHFNQENVLTTETYKMPSAEVRVDQEFARKLIEKGNIKADDELHKKEYGVEAQLPYLQYVYKDKLEKIKILPIAVGSNEKLKELSLDIKEILIDLNKSAVIICSTNFMEYGTKYKYVPFTENTPENITKWDGVAINFIKNKDIDGFLDYVKESMSTISAPFAIVLFIYLLDRYNISLLQYYLSGDVNDDYKNTISYASLIAK